MSSPVPQSIHTVPAVDSGVPQPPDWAQLKAWGATLVAQIEGSIAQALFNISVLGVKPFVALQQFGTEVLGAVTNLQSLIDALANALGFSGTNHTTGNIQTYFTTVAGQIQNLGVTGLYDAEQGFANLGSSLLKFITASGPGIGQFDASGLTGDINSAVNFSGHALSTVLGGIEAATGDFVGTVTGAVDSAATIAGQLASTVQSNAQGGLDAIVQAAANDLALVNQAPADVLSYLGSFFSGLTASASGGNTASPPPASANDAVLAVGTIQQRLATIGNGAEEQVDVEFSAYSNGAVPAAFTVISGSGMSISGGKLVFNSSGAEYLQYNAVTTLTDYQEISGAWSSMTGSIGVGLYGRANGAGSVYGVQMYFDIAVGAWFLEGRNSSNTLQWQVELADTFTTGATYTLLAGDSSSPYKFQVLKNGTPLTITSSIIGPYAAQVGQTYLDDTSSLSVYGGAYRGCGLLASNVNMAMSSFKFQDTTESEPTVFVSTAEATSSSTYGQLATASDEVAVKVGDSGKVLVYLDANSSSANGFVSVSASGANTIAASDDNAAAGINAIHATLLFTNLAPGTTLFNMEYRSSSGSVTFSRRRVTAIAL